MNFKETLFFVAKCLTISKDEKNKVAIEKQLKNGKVDWDNVVKVSTSHYVFPALYLNLKKVNFLNYLPDDLVEYMKHITDLNRDRNEQIIAQAKDLNILLQKNGIQPIFLKGASYLLENLYDDIAERMVGDIDFIVSKKEYKKTAEILHNYGYETVLKTKNHFPQFKHYPRITKKGSIAAVEIHKELLVEKYSDEFNFELINREVSSFQSISILSTNHQLILSIISKQINDNGISYKDISLKTAYDIFLLSKKANTYKAVEKEKFNKLFNPLNSYLAICNFVLNDDSITFKNDDFVTSYISNYENSLNDSNSEKKFKQQKKINSLKTRIDVILKAFTNKPHRKWLINRIIYGRVKKG
ncbi:nucleotidyltransferase family protein [Polaribacter sp.]|nr:nucleotidyltransferase family protein [Polaribacter sp.]